MKKIDFKNSEEEKHICSSKCEGDWIIYKCSHPECDYERRFNFKTGEMSFIGTQTEILHKGEYLPDGIKSDNLNMN